MRNRKVIIILLLVLALAIVAFTGTTVAANGRSRYTATMRVHPSQDPTTPIVPGSSATLVTNRRGATVRIKTTLTPGHAATVWWAIINNPAACATSPCTAADILGNTAAVEAQVSYATGQVVRRDGQVAFSARLRKGVVPGGWYAGQEFTNPTGAEIHVIINDHGPVLREFMPGMIETYRGGCTDESLPAAFPDSAKADGEPGPNTCRLVQFAIFQQ